jgi:hypothetical protein
VFGGASPPDSVALAGLIAPHVGPPSHADAPPRSIPQTLDIAVWLGAPEARAILHESGGDAFDGYDAALAKVAAPPEDAMHASAHGSILAAIGASLHVPRASHAQDAAAIESALAAWTWLRHDGRPFSRPKPKSAPRAPKEMRVTGAPLPAWVEPAPEVVARLLGAVKQLERGLAARGPLDASTSGMTTLAEIEDILRGAQKIAEDELRGELDDADRAALAAFPARVQALETEDATTAVPVVVEIASDAAHGGPILESATGLVEPAALLLKETRSGRVVLGVGAHVAQHEISAVSANREGDASLRDRLATTPLPRPAYVARFHP